MPSHNNKEPVGSDRLGIRRAPSGRGTRSRAGATNRHMDMRGNDDLTSNVVDLRDCSTGDSNNSIRIRNHNTSALTTDTGAQIPSAVEAMEATPQTSDAPSATLVTTPLWPSTKPSATAETSTIEFEVQVPSTVKASPTNIALSRLHKELSDFLNDAPENCSAALVESNLFEWKGKIIGPLGSPYENGVFRVAIDIPHDYPFHPPEVRFLTKIYHCNISRDGHICLDVLSDQWSPALTIGKTLLSIVALLTDANPNDPVEATTAALYVSNRQEHDKIAREWTRRYANPDDDSD